MVEKIKWKLYLRWEVVQYRMKSRQLKRKIFMTRVKTAVIKALTKFATGEDA